MKEKSKFHRRAAIFAHIFTFSLRQSPHLDHAIADEAVGADKTQGEPGRPSSTTAMLPSQLRQLQFARNQWRGFRAAIMSSQACHPLFALQVHE
ncbi:hypothetical protein [Dyella choica]|uniref:Uncharacterized protein n=1 Tax=Dyella choica TaxID=1927959 RepID=A0A432M906_9GAMM|nr:hypothetical protein [Dyella choica]RUL77736.1 hypothetical protein EKH80_07665 [Dyella choica]